jgi:hypothetical protein
MKPNEITERVEAIARVLDNSKAAHNMEDKLQLDFIKYVAAEKTVPISVRRKAKQVVEVSTWNFPRVCG